MGTEVKKRLGFKDLSKPWKNKWNGETLIPFEYYKNIKEDWEKLAFLLTHHTVTNNGDIHGMDSGVNNSGKTNTAIAILKEMNRLYREYWKVSYNKNKFIEIPEFDLEKNIAYLPVESSLDDLLGDTQFRTQDLNEGMKFATRANWQNKKAQDAAATAYVARAHFPTVFYEYQVSTSPPGYFQTRFNLWIHKMSKRWMVVSSASGLYRKADPYYLDELTKLRTDEEISSWFVHKNPNYIIKMKAPRMTKKDEKKFKKLQAEAHLKLQSANRIKMELDDSMFIKIEELWKRVQNNEITKMDFEEVMKSDYPEMTKDQYRRFMRMYQKFEDNQMFGKKV